MEKAVESYTEAIDRFPSTALLAAALRKPESTCRSWRTRDSIPPEYFDLIAAAARELRVSLTARQLWDIFNARKHRRINPSEGEG
mgnify:CR=1 FL=1